MKRLLLIALLFCCAREAGAQTDALFRKSIGGAIESGTPGEADFGIPRHYRERVTRVDSLIWVSKEVSVLVTGTYRKISLTEGRIPERLDVVRDTFYNHPLFAQRHALDSIRAEMKQLYGEQAAQTRYVRYDNHRRKEKPARRKAEAPKTPAQTPVTAVPVVEPAGRGGLFAGGTALFALMLSVAIVSLYRKAGNAS